MQRFSKKSFSSNAHNLKGERASVKTPGEVSALSSPTGGNAYFKLSHLPCPSSTVNTEGRLLGMLGGCNQTQPQIRGAGARRTHRQVELKKPTELKLLTTTKAQDFKAKIATLQFSVLRQVL